MRPLNLFSAIILVLVLLSVVIFANPTVVEHSIKFADVNNAALVGEDGLAMKTSDGGLTWTTMATGVTNVLYGNDFFNNNTMIAVGENGIILKTTDGGNSWEIKSGGVLTNLYDIDVIDASNAFVCGAEGILLYTTDTGDTWIQCYTQPGLVLNDINFYDPFLGFAVGTASTVLKTSDGGVTWSDLKPIISEIFTVNAIAVKSPDLLTIVGDGGMLYNSTDGGFTWSQVPITSNGENIRDITFFTATDGVIIGQNGLVQKTSDGGAIWFSVAPVVTFSTLEPHAVAFSNSTTGMFVGSGGVQMYTTDAGDTWSLILSETSPKAKSKEISKPVNYPNPFNPTTKISFEMPAPGSVSVRVFDITGREAANIFNGYVKAGVQEFVFNASALSSGVYFYKIASNINGNNNIHTGRMLLVK